MAGGFWLAVKVKLYLQVAMVSFVLTFLTAGAPCNAPNENHPLKKSGVTGGIKRRRCT